MNLESLGAPTATICTDEFAQLGQSEAKSLGMSALPLATVPHPLSGNVREMLEAKARGVVEQVVYVLTQSRERLEAEFEGKDYPRPKGLARSKQIFR